jgi:hypothetical protein
MLVHELAGHIPHHAGLVLKAAVGEFHHVHVCLLEGMGDKG